MDNLTQKALCSKAYLVELLRGEIAKLPEVVAPSMEAKKVNLGEVFKGYEWATSQWAEPACMAIGVCDETVWPDSALILFADPGGCPKASLTMTNAIVKLQAAQALTTYQSGRHIEQLADSAKYRQSNCNLLNASNANRLR